MKVVHFTRRQRSVRTMWPGLTFRNFAQDLLLALSLLSLAACISAQCCEGLVGTAAPVNTAAGCASPFKFTASCATGLSCLGMKCTQGSTSSYSQQCLTADGFKTVLTTANTAAVAAGGTCVDLAKTSSASMIKGIGGLFFLTMAISAFQVVMH